jgi:ParB-like chromosome segregation protein Spo0J
MKNNEKSEYKLPDGRVMPLQRLRWIHRSTLSPNNYNPNSVAPPELDLLKTSIKEDGWTQPIVANPDMTIVDGFHRWTVSGHEEIYNLTEGFVPVVILEPKDREHQQMSTIRHNRARGRHGVLQMGRIVQDLIDGGKTVEEVMKRLQMEREEVIRLTNTQGVMGHPDLDKPYSKAWIPAQNKTND